MISKSALNVLLVEDNPDHAALAKNAILSAKSRRYAVTLCSTAEDAQAVVKSEQIHLVVSDFQLPGMNGLQFLEWLHHQGISIPFVMMTGMGDEKTAVKAMQEGAYNYIVKDDVYLNVLPHVVDETFIKFLADQEREKYELEIRKKNVALEKANRELKKLDQLKSDFIASVSHDIRTPLNSVQESIALILEGIVNPSTEKGKEVLAIAKRSISRLTSMINDLLDFSKLEAGKMRLHIEPCDLQVLVDEVLDSLRNLAEKKRMTFTFHPEKMFPKVACDAERMLQVLTNLVGNAIKFTPEAGTVTVRMEAAEDEQVKVTVSDTGVGIAKENLDRIFERFEQVKMNGSKTTPGTGLGLSICREIVKLHGGSIFVESELGRGSHFIVMLPIQHRGPKESRSITKETVAT